MASFLEMTGPAEDLEVNYMLKPTMVLPDPKGIPFRKQGVPIYFDQPHITQYDVEQATNYFSVNPLPFDRFYGIGVNGGPPRQINQPDFLSINEDIYLQ